jgi:hypothetical protein
MNIDLSVPIWAIDHLSEALGVSIDTAREHTYSPSFPAARAGFARNVWLRDQVLAWFAGLPAADRSRPKRRKTTPKPTAPAVALPTADQTVKGRAHKRRAAKPVAA